MNPKQLRVTCPCCQSRLWVDVLTAKVVRAARPGEERAPAGEADWEQAMGRVQGRVSQSADKMDAALERERTREADLDDLFRKARDRAKDEDET